MMKCAMRNNRIWSQQWGHVECIFINYHCRHSQIDDSLKLDPPRSEHCCWTCRWTRRWFIMIALFNWAYLGEQRRSWLSESESGKSWCVRSFRHPNFDLMRKSRDTPSFLFAQENLIWVSRKTPHYSSSFQMQRSVAGMTSSYCCSCISFT